MKDLFNRVWNDPVGSDVIAGLICLVIGAIVCKVFNINININQ